MSEKSKIILFIQGGAGDILAHTPMIRGMRKKYPDDELIVLSTYSQLLEGNPNIDKLITLKDPQDFYSEYILGKNVRFFKKHFVYDALMDLPAAGVKCLPEFICKCYDVEYDGENLDYFITDYEKRAAKTFTSQFTKPIILLHIFGAVPSDGARNKTNALKDLNPSIVAPIVAKYKDKYDFLQIGLKDEPLVPGAFDCLEMPLRDAIALIPLAKSYIFIESIFAHCTNALNTSGVVVFQNTNPEFFGYKNNFNTWDSGGCKNWPCNRPVGALLDFAAGYKNPKTREKILWECKPKQSCAQMKTEDLEKVFLDSFERTKVVNADLEAARNTPPPIPEKVTK